MMNKWEKEKHTKIKKRNDFAKQTSYDISTILKQAA